MNYFKFVTSKHVLIYVGGLITATCGSKFLKSKCARKAAVNTLAKGMKLRNDVMSAFESIKEEAQDICFEAQKQSKEEQKCALNNQ